MYFVLQDIKEPDGTAGNRRTVCKTRHFCSTMEKWRNRSVQFLKKQPEEYPEHLEAGTLNGHGIAGLLAAVQEIERIGQRQIYEKEHRLMTLL